MTFRRLWHAVAIEALIFAAFVLGLVIGAAVEALT
jgi:hypothetical protein